MRQLDSVINRMQQFHNEEWHSDLEVNILSNLASISVDSTAAMGQQVWKPRLVEAVREFTLSVFFFVAMAADWPPSAA